MTSGQYTDNQTSLPLMERARRGLLADESELWICEIIELEFPSQYGRDGWLHWADIICVSIGFSLLGNARVLQIPGKLDGARGWYIPRDAYRTWRATQSNPPNGSLIHLWIGTVERESESKAPKTKRTSKFKRRLESFMSYLNELEKAGDFDRNSIMEKKEELHDGLKKYDRKLWEWSFSTFEGFVKQAHKEIDFFIPSGPRPRKPS